jgi:hypothetical protein
MCVLQVVDPSAIHRRGPPDYTMNFVPLFQEEFRQVRTVLSSDPRYQGLLRHL